MSNIEEAIRLVKGLQPEYRIFGGTPATYHSAEVVNMRTSDRDALIAELERLRQENAELRVKAYLWDGHVAFLNRQIEIQTYG